LVFFFFLEEEILLVFAVIFTLDAVGGLVKEVVWSLLEHKNRIIFFKLTEYFSEKKQLLQRLLLQYEERVEIETFITKIYVESLDDIIEYSLEKYFLEVNIIEQYIAGQEITSSLLFLYKKTMLEDIRDMLYGIEYVIAGDNEHEENEIGREIYELLEEEYGEDEDDEQSDNIYEE